MKYGWQWVDEGDVLLLVHKTLGGKLDLMGILEGAPTLILLLNESGMYHL